MFFDIDGIRLNAKLELPDSEEEKSPLLILSHGFTGHMEEPHILGVAAAARAAGYAVLRVELYGHGHSGGSFHDHTVRIWVDELVQIADRMKRLDFVSKIYLCGHSQGGLAVMLAAAERKDAVAGLIPLSPAWTFPAQARAGELLGFRFDPARVPPELPLGKGANLSGNYLRVLQSLDVEAAIRAYEGPVLLVQGTADETVPFAGAGEAAAMYKDCTLIPIEGDTHCFDRHLDQMTAAVQSWLAARL